MRPTTRWMSRATHHWGTWANLGGAELAEGEPLTEATPWTEHRVEDMEAGALTPRTSAAVLPLVVIYTSCHCCAVALQWATAPSAHLCARTLNTASFLDRFWGQMPVCHANDEDIG